MKNILPKIELHYTYLVIAIGFIITGYFLNLIIFTSIILIHELGHYSMAKLLGIEVSKIIVYPYGGLTKLNHKINISINKELLIAFSGVIVQSVYFLLIFLLFKSNIIRLYSYNLFQKYHYTILFFNLLPIIPLDGSKILNLYLSKVLKYRIANNLNVIISLITIIFLLFFFKYKIDYTYFIILSIIINNIYDYLFDLKYLYHRFLIERYLYNIKYSKIKIIRRRKDFYKNYSHIIRKENKYIKEKEYLRKTFDLDKKI